MKTLKIITLILMTILTVACNNDDNDNNQPDTSDTQLKIIAKGTAEGQNKIIANPETGAATLASCFLIELFDADTDALIGNLENCDAGTTELEDGSFVSVIRTTFNIGGKGSIIAKFSILQVPIENGFFAASFTPTENNIMSGTVDFEGKEGKITLNGVIDRSQLDNNILNIDYEFDIEFIEQSL